MESQAGEKLESYFERYVDPKKGPYVRAKQHLHQLPDDKVQVDMEVDIGSNGSKLHFIQVFGSFKYPPLPGPDYIRLLHLEPASADTSVLRGSLKVHKLDENCEYEAISYSWGDYPQFGHSIILGDQLLKLTGNLYAALMAFSFPDRVRVLWADAICINQADTVEKTQQVAMMGDIYSKAKTVQVWLTLGSGWMTEAMKFMVGLSSKTESFGISNDVDRPRIVHDLPSVGISSAEATALLREAITSHVDYLLFRAWFNRVWVVQEVTLAAKLAVSCGHSTMDWTTFARALEILRGAFRKVPMGEEWKRMEGVKVAWELVRTRDMFRLLAPLNGLDHHHMTNLVGRQMMNKACSDDRDRVYGMLAMTKSPYALKPDYDKTVPEAYTEFTRKYSPNTQIYWAGLCRRQRKSYLVTRNDAENSERPPTDITDRYYLPSWVPEFRPNLNLAWASPFCGAYLTAALNPFWFLTSSDMPNVMCVTGTLFDTIIATSWEYHAKDTDRRPYSVYDPGFFFSVIRTLQDISSLSPDFVVQPDSEPQWLTLAKVLTGGVSECSEAESLLAKYPIFETLEYLRPGSLPWLTAIWDRFAKHCFTPTGEVYQHLLLKALGGKPPELSEDANIALGFLVYVANTMVPNRLFVTWHGYVGLAAKDIQRHDFVAIFNGCHMPYVVRPAGKITYKNEEIPGALQVIGPCYVQGIMRGEFVTNRDAPQFSRLKWTRREGDPIDSLDGWLYLV
jgi:hypothetical protein